MDFFPFFVKDGRTLFILESKYGCKGTGFFTNVLRFLCLTPDHHYCISAVRNSDAMYFFSKLHCDEEAGIDMLNIMAETGKINKNLWLQKKIIYCEDLVNSLVEAYRRRENKPLTIDQISAIYQLMPSEIELMPSEIELPRIDDGKNTQRREEKRRKEKRVLCVYPEDFETFFKAYPKHTGKKGALTEWKKATGKPLLEDILSAIENQKRAKRELTDAGQFAAEWPDPERWIKKARWEDETPGRKKEWYE